jgi:drug/metabolite transporter (DMT)-like permease
MPLNNYSTRQKAYICLAAVSILWGTTWMASRQGVRFMPALQMAGIRQFLAGALYVSYFTFKGLKWPARQRVGNCTGAGNYQFRFQ